ncbi:PepSY domain-containing protein [Rhodobacteraceae bacterium NNCM2]|nr:PepSY domain-containing protein [Coraliihabitans acroporae]
MTRFMIALAAVALATPALADEKPSEEEISKINMKLAEMLCEVDDDEIEKEDYGYELDDVMCSDGVQYDIKFDHNLEVIEKEAE